MIEQPTQITNTKLPTPRTGHPVTSEQAITAMRISNAEELKQSLISALQLIRESNSPDFEGGFPNMTSTVAPRLDVYDPATLESGHNILKAWYVVQLQKQDTAKDTELVTQVVDMLKALKQRLAHPVKSGSESQQQPPTEAAEGGGDPRIISWIDRRSNKMLGKLLGKPEDQWLTALKTPPPNLLSPTSESPKKPNEKPSAG